jgi:hypothetical protein
LKESYHNRHLLNLPECIRCSAALFCGGGCLSEARIQKGTIFTSYCHWAKQGIYCTDPEGILFEKGGEIMKKTRITEAAVGVAAGITIAVMAGRYSRQSDLRDASGFSTIAATEEWAVVRTHSRALSSRTAE